MPCLPVRNLPKLTSVRGQVADVSERPSAGKVFSHAHVHTVILGISYGFSDGCRCCLSVLHERVREFILFFFISLSFPFLIPFPVEYIL